MHQNQKSTLDAPSHSFFNLTAWIFQNFPQTTVVRWIYTLCQLHPISLFDLYTTYYIIVKILIARRRISNTRQVWHFCMWKCVFADNANGALSAQTNFHIQKCNICRVLEKWGRAMKVKLSSVHYSVFPMFGFCMGGPHTNLKWLDYLFWQCSRGRLVNLRPDLRSWRRGLSESGLRT